MTKNFARIGTMIAACAFALAGMAGAAELMPVQDFGTYTAGDIVGQDGWDSTTTPATADKVTISAAADVNHPGQTTIGGSRSILFDGGGDDVGKSFTVQSAAAGTTLYYSLVLSAVDTASFVAPGGYIAHFTEGTSGNGFRGRLWMAEAGGTAPQLGIDISSGDTPTLASVPLTYGTPIFAVVKLTYNAGAIDDVAALFINQTGASEGIPDATETGIDFLAIGRFGIRQDAVADTPTMSIDNIRTGTTWADVVVGGGSAVGEWEMYE